MKLPMLVCASARPLKTPPGTDATFSVLVDNPDVVPTIGDQPSTSPFSLAKMNNAAPFCIPECTKKSLVGLNTAPVGAPPAIFTTSGTIDGFCEPLPPLYN